MAAPNRPTQQDRFRKIVAAIPKYLSQVTAIILAGITYTPITLAQFFLDQIKLLDDATNARAALHQAVEAIKENKATKGPVLKAFNDYILSVFVNQPAILAEFAIAARKAPAKKVNTKALAAAKLLATRQARNVMGKKQRKAVKGQVSDQVTAVLAPEQSKSTSTTTPTSTPTTTSTTTSTSTSTSTSPSPSATPNVVIPPGPNASPQPASPPAAPGAAVAPSAATPPAHP